MSLLKVSFGISSRIFVDEANPAKVARTDSLRPSDEMVRIPDPSSSGEPEKTSHGGDIAKLLEERISPESLRVIRNALQRKCADPEATPVQTPQAGKFGYSAQSSKALADIRQEFGEAQLSSKENQQRRNSPGTLKEQVKTILGSCQIKLKYEELLLPGRALMLPVAYKQVMRVAGALDAVLNYFKSRGRLQCFDEIRKSIESTYQMYGNLIQKPRE